MKEITLEERKQVQLKMLVEIDEICRKHNIKYTLAFGTLLGAIRHKGFIPWDDDVDISMPLEDMFRFKNVLKSENLKYCDVDTVDGYCFHFSKISYKPTYRKIGLRKSYGVNIDLYPTIQVPFSTDEIERLLKIGFPLLQRRLNFMKWQGRISKFLPIKIPGYKKSIRAYRDYSFYTLNRGGGNYHCLAGDLKLFDKHTFDFDPFETLIDVEFEGFKFMAPYRYHDYLTKRYGDYMQLPPEEDRHPYHGGKYYWK